VPAKDIDLKVGIIQRFGDENKDQLNLKEPKGEILTIRFLSQHPRLKYGGFVPLTSVS
jgi:hypothetical protein